MAAYLLGLAVVAAAGASGIHPVDELWTRTDGVSYLLVHLAVHLPFWQFTLQMAFLPFTAIVVGALVLAGFVVTAGATGEPDAHAGRAIVLGYGPLTLGATIVLLASNGAITAIRMVAPLVLVGVVVPGVLGGVGGALAVSYAESRAGD
jgi:hypothetical protein